MILFKIHSVSFFQLNQTKKAINKDDFNVGNFVLLLFISKLYTKLLYAEKYFEFIKSVITGLCCCLHGKYIKVLMMAIATGLDDVSMERYFSKT